MSSSSYYPNNAVPANGHSAPPPPPHHVTVGVPVPFMTNQAVGESSIPAPPPQQHATMYAIQHNGLTTTTTTTAPTAAVAAQSIATGVAVTARPAAATAAASSSTNSTTTDGRPRRPLMTTTKDGKELSEKKLRRLEKNRESARASRKRKREAAEDLVRQIAVMEGENLRLRLQLQIGQEAQDSQNFEQDRVTSELDALLKSGASEAEIYATIEKFKEKFADYGRDRRSAVEFHLQNVERLLMPTQTTSIVMNAMQGAATTAPFTGNNSDDNSTTKSTTTGTTANLTSESSGVSSVAMVGSNIDTNVTEEEANTTKSEGTDVFEDSKPPAVVVVAPPAANGVVSSSAASADSTITNNSGVPALNEVMFKKPKALFEYLVKYLEVTPEQSRALKDSRFVAKEMDETLAESLKLLQELRCRLIKIGDDLETEFDSVRSILTPTQAAKFLIWVAKNQACVHMLNELWRQDHPEEEEDPVDEEQTNESNGGDLTTSTAAATTTGPVPETSTASATAEGAKAKGATFTESAAMDVTTSK